MHTGNMCGPVRGLAHAPGSQPGACEQQSCVHRGRGTCVCAPNSGRSTACAAHAGDTLRRAAGRVKRRSGVRAGGGKCSRECGERRRLGHGERRAAWAQGARRESAYRAKRWARVGTLGTGIHTDANRNKSSVPVDRDAQPHERSEGQRGAQQGTRGRRALRDNRGDGSAQRTQHGSARRSRPASRQGRQAQDPAAGSAPARHQQRRRRSRSGEHVRRVDGLAVPHGGAQRVGLRQGGAQGTGVAGEGGGQVRAAGEGVRSRLDGTAAPAARVHHQQRQKQARSAAAAAALAAADTGRASTAGRQQQQQPQQQGSSKAAAAAAAACLQVGDGHIEDQGAVQGHIRLALVLEVLGTRVGAWWQATIEVGTANRGARGTACCSPPNAAASRTKVARLLRRTVHRLLPAARCLQQHRGPKWPACPTWNMAQPSLA